MKFAWLDNFQLLNSPDGKTLNYEIAPCDIFITKLSDTRFRVLITTNILWSLFFSKLLMFLLKSELNREDGYASTSITIETQNTSLLNNLKLNYASFNLNKAINSCTNLNFTENLIWDKLSKEPNPSYFNSILWPNRSIYALLDYNEIDKTTNTQLRDLIMDDMIVVINF